MLVVTLQQQWQILAGSGVQSLSISGDENITLDDRRRCVNSIPPATYLCVCSIRRDIQ